MITSKQASLIGFAGLLGLVVATQQGCGSDTSGATGSTAGAPAAGAPAAGAPGAGAPATGGGGAATAGAPAAGAPAGGGGAGGGSAGSAGAGGSAAGSGGTGGGAAGSGGAGGGSAGSAGAGAGGGGAVTFAAVNAIMSASCAVSMCHDGSNQHVNYKTNLYSVLTTALPAATDRCAGTTLVVPSNTAGSFLITAITKGGNCPTGGNMIGRMPYMCSTTSSNPRACLTDAQIKTITDWVAAGAPM